jgi:hypothetical protein
MGNTTTTFVCPQQQCANNTTTTSYLYQSGGTFKERLIVSVKIVNIEELSCSLYTVVINVLYMRR